MEEDVHDNHAEHGLSELSKTLDATVLGIVWWGRYVPVWLPGEDIEEEVALDGGEWWDIAHHQAVIDLI